MKRAALIITDCDQVEVTDWCAEAGKHQNYAWPTEQLLADLRTLLHVFDVAVESETLPVFDAEIDAAARVRALLPKEEDENE